MSYVVSITPDMKLVTEALDQLGTEIEQINYKVNPEVLSLIVSHDRAMIASRKELARLMDEESKRQEWDDKSLLQKGSSIASGVGTGVASGVNNGLQNINKNLLLLQGRLGPIDVGLHLVSQTMGTMGAVAGAVAPEFKPLFDVLGAIPGVVSGIVGSLTSMAGKASPALMEQFSYALEDVQGVIGGTFLPILRLMTEGVRLFGDVMATILPSTSEVASVLQEFRGPLNEIIGEIRQLAVDFGPLIKDVLLTGLRGLASVMIEVARAAVILGNQLRDLLGLPRLPGTTNSSVGAAARPAQIQGIESYQLQLQQAAASQPSGPTMADVPTTVSGISVTLNQIQVSLQQLTPQEIANAVGRVLRTFTTSPASTAAAVSESSAVSLLVPGAGALADLYRWINR